MIIGGKDLLAASSNSLCTHNISLMQISTDPELEVIRAERNYNYQDIITVMPEKLPNYEQKDSPLPPSLPHCCISSMEDSQMGRQLIIINKKRRYCQLKSLWREHKWRSWFQTHLGLTTNRQLPHNGNLSLYNSHPATSQLSHSRQHCFTRWLEHTMQLLMT